MAYTPVPTKATGDLAYSADFINAFIRDNFAAGVPDIFTTKGDLAAATAADTAARLAVGANNALLIAESGESVGIKWNILPHLRAHGNTADETSESDSFTLIANVDSEDYDTTAGYANDAFTCPVAGYYLVIVRMTVETSTGASTATVYETGVLKNDVLYSVLGSFHWLNATALNQLVYGMDIVSCAAGDVLKPAKRMNNASGGMSSEGHAYASTFEVSLIPV